MASMNIFFHKHNSKFTKRSKAFSFILYFVLTSEFLNLFYPLRLKSRDIMRDSQAVLPLVARARHMAVRQVFVGGLLQGI